MFNDDASIISNASSGSYFRDDDDRVAAGSAGIDDLSTEEIFEEKLRDAIDMASQKSSQGRTKALENVCRGLQKRMAADFVDDRRVTLTDVIEKSLKRGKDQEQLAAAKLAMLVSLQGSDSEEVFRDLQTTLTSQMLDPSSTPKSRGGMASALGVLTFLGCEWPEFGETLEALEKVFVTSCNPNNAVKLSPETTAMHTEALSVWTLLRSVMPSSKASFYLEGQWITKWAALLESPDVDLRIAAGEAVVVLFEQACEAYDDNGEEAYNLVAELLPQLKELSTDSHKYRSKKDRKEQKSSFRDILKTIDDDENYYEKIKINTRERLEIDSWAQKRQYDALCKVLGSGMNLYLTENSLVRDIFGLGMPLPVANADAINASRPSKLERVRDIVLMM